MSSIPPIEPIRTEGVKVEDRALSPLCSVCGRRLTLARDNSWYCQHSDALHDAILVLERIDLASLSAHPETEDAGNRVAIALGYLREAIKVEPQAQTIEPREKLARFLRGEFVPEEPLRKIADLLRGSNA